MELEKLKSLIKEEATSLVKKNKAKSGQQVLDMFLDAMINVIAPYLPDEPVKEVWR